MPLFDYRCGCGRRAELLQPFGGRPTFCLVCEEPMQRVWSKAAMHHKPAFDTEGLMRRFGEYAQERDGVYADVERREGQPVGRPVDPWDVADARARERVRRGEVDLRELGQVERHNYGRHRLST